MKTPTGKNVLDYLFVLRPVLMMPVWTIFLLGSAFRATQLPDRITADLILGCLILFWLFGAVYLLNQYFDIESDRLNNKLHFLPLGLVSKQVAIFLCVILNVAALGASLTVSLPFFALAILIALLGIAYSAPPWRLKDRPYAALIANALAHGSIVFLFGWSAAHGSLAEGLIISLPYFFAVGAIYILTTVPDIDGDAASGKRTLAVVMGRTRAARWAFGWYLASVLLAIYSLDLLFLLAAIPVALFFYRASRGDAAIATQTVRWSVGLLSLVACIYYPWYALVLLAGFFATRAYYRRRFDLIYP